MARPGIDKALIGHRNEAALDAVENDYEALRDTLGRRGVEIDRLKQHAKAFEAIVSTTCLSVGGTRLGRFPQPGEPRNILDRLDDCTVLQQLTGATPRVGLHLPWDRHDEPAELVSYAEVRGLRFATVSPTLFQDQPGQAHSYRFGSLSHTDPEVRKQAVRHAVECIAFGRSIGCRALSIWTGEGADLPGQAHPTGAYERHLASLAEVYAAVPADWRLFIRHGARGPALHAPLLQDWGSSQLVAGALGERASCLVDISANAGGGDLATAVARLVQHGKFGGFHHNDGSGGDDRLDPASVQPYRFFLLLCALVDAERAGAADLDPVHVIDVSSKATDPMESLIVSATEIVRAHLQAHLVDREALAKYQEENDALMASETLKQAFRTDVDPILALARHEKGASIDPLATYRASGYRQRIADLRPKLGS